MKYTSEIIVEVPLSEFVKKMDNADNMKHWQKGLTKYEFIEGNPGEVGAKMKIYYDMGKRKVELTETIIKNNFPHQFSASYDAPGMYSTQNNRFSETAEGYTKWISEAEFTSDKVMYKIMLFLMPGMFKKQSMEYMKDFKAFAETGASVASDPH